MRAIITAAAVLIPVAAFGQAWTPPDCVGTNKALQYTKGSWICATISGVQGAQGPQGPQGPQGIQGPPGNGVPAAPPPTQCITSNWDGAKWNCVPTNYLTTDEPPQPQPTQQRR